jgi:putative heme-binding domain-containing protein
MPSFRSLGTPEIQAVVQHLRQLQGHGKSEHLPGDPKTGQALFFGKAECSHCHMMNGEGGFIASDLSSYGSGRPANEVRSAVTSPDKNLDLRKSTVVVTTAEGKIYRGIARNEDNFSLQVQTMDGAFHLFSKAELQNFEYESRSLMPNDYGSKFTRKEIDDLVSYLIDAGRSHKQQRSTEEPD